MIDRACDGGELLAIPAEQLSAEALRGVVESFVLREGTDYGAREYSLAEKVAHVMRQLERGEAQILFEANTETITIVPTAVGCELEPDHAVELLASPTKHQHGR